MTRIVALRKLVRRQRDTHYGIMAATQFLPRHPSAAMRRLWFTVGCMLLIATPPIALLPGPGGTVTFGLGLGLVLKYSPWAKRRYVAFKRRWPKSGAWADWGLRRASARRRIARGKEAVTAGNARRH